MNWLLMTKIGILFCLKLLTLVTLSIVIYIRTLGGAIQSHAPKNSLRAKRAAMPPYLSSLNLSLIQRGCPYNRLAAQEDSCYESSSKKNSHH